MDDLASIVQAALERKVFASAFFGTSTKPSASPESLTLARLNETMALCTDLRRNAPPPMPRIVESIYCSDAVEDWSAVRSPARARRRRRIGHRQRVKIVRVPWKDGRLMADGILVMHPVTARTFRDELARRAKERP